MIQFVDPRGVRQAEPLPYQLAHHLSEASTVALMANGFPGSVAFLTHVGRALAERYGVTVTLHNKGNASALAPEAMLSDAAAADAVVAAYGH